MRPTHIQIAKTSGNVYAQQVHGRLATSKVSHLIGKLRPASTNTIDLAPGVGYDDDLEEIIRFLVSKGIPRSDIQVVWPGPTPEKVIANKVKGELSQLRLRIGSDVAERDQQLTSYFISTATARYVASDERHIIVGPKGAGKTAILNSMQQRNKYSITITPEHYATDLLNAVESANLSHELNIYISTWRYSLLVEIMQNIVANHKHSPQVKRIRSYLQVNGLLSDQSETIFERFLSYLKRFTKVTGGMVGGELSVELSEENDPQGLFRMPELLELIPSIRAALRNNPLHIYIDELDQSWDNSSRSNNFLIALFTAALQIRGYSDSLHIFIFLRSEIFSLLKSNMAQLDKFRSDIIEIRWTSPDLKFLIAARLKHSLGITEDIPHKMILDEIFQDTRNELHCNPFDYLISRTTYRPREVIQICTLAIEAAERNEAHRVSSQYILQAEEQFSAWKLEHIISENLYILPRLDELLERMRGLTRTCPNSTLSDICMRFVLSAQSANDCPEWIKKIGSEEDILELLYKCEIIGVEAASPTRDREQGIWNGFDFHYMRPGAKTHLSSTFMVHPALWRALEIVGS